MLKILLFPLVLIVRRFPRAAAMVACWLFGSDVAYEAMCKVKASHKRAVLQTIQL